MNRQLKKLVNPGNQEKGENSGKTYCISSLMGRWEGPTRVSSPLWARKVHDFHLKCQHHPSSLPTRPWSNTSTLLDCTVVAIASRCRRSRVTLHRGDWHGPKGGGDLCRLPHPWSTPKPGSTHLNCHQKVARKGLDWAMLSCASTCTRSSLAPSAP
jgi:hypothetical protein